MDDERAQHVLFPADAEHSITSHVRLTAALQKPVLGRVLEKESTKTARGKTLASSLNCFVYTLTGVCDERFASSSKTLANPRVMVQSWEESQRSARRVQGEERTHQLDYGFEHL